MAKVHLICSDWTDPDGDSLPEAGRSDTLSRDGFLPKDGAEDRFTEPNLNAQTVFGYTPDWMGSCQHHTGAINAARRLWWKKPKSF